MCEGRVGYSGKRWKKPAVARLILRDGQDCLVCGCAAEPSQLAPVKVRAGWEGGSEWIGNLVLCCKTCESRRDQKTLWDWVSEVAATGGSPDFRLLRRAALRSRLSPLSRREVWDRRCELWKRTRGWQRDELTGVVSLDPALEYLSSQPAEESFKAVCERIRSHNPLLRQPQATVSQKVPRLTGDRGRYLVRSIRRRDGELRCVWCSRELSNRTATVEHLVPRSQGGTNQLCNLLVACRRCNSLRGSLDIDRTLQFCAQTQREPRWEALQAGIERALAGSALHPSGKGARDRHRFSARSSRAILARQSERARALLTYPHLMSAAKNVGVGFVVVLVGMGLTISSPGLFFVGTLIVAIGVVWMGLGVVFAMLRPQEQGEQAEREDALDELDTAPAREPAAEPAQGSHPGLSGSSLAADEELDDPFADLDSLTEGGAAPSHPAAAPAPAPSHPAAAPAPAPSHPAAAPAPAPSRPAAAPAPAPSHSAAPAPGWAEDEEELWPEDGERL